MVLQILVRQPKYQRPSPMKGAPGKQLTPPPHRSPPSTAGGNNANNNSGNRRTSVPLASPGSLPMAVIGTATTAAPAALEAPERYTQIVAVWQSDCLLCGLSPFDKDTLVLLGYPVDEDDDDDDDGGGEEGGRGEGRMWRGGRGVFQPEVQLVKRANGEVRKGGK